MNCSLYLIQTNYSKDDNKKCFHFFIFICLPVTRDEVIVKPKSLDDEDEAISDADQIDDPSAVNDDGDQENGNDGVVVNSVATDSDSAEDQDDDVFYDSDVIEQDEE